MQDDLHDAAQSLLADLILPFYAIERDMTVLGDPNRKENDAEHSWSLAILACSLAPHIDPKLDVSRVAEFAIVHDLTEVFAGDTSVWDSKDLLDSKATREAEALKIIQEKFVHFPWLVETLEAYERKDTDEAKFVWAIDKYIALSIRFRENGSFFKAQGITQEQFESTLVEHRKKAHAHPGAAVYYEKMRKAFAEHPEYFANS
jgi:putative hydrolase of HD superfamily